LRFVGDHGTSPGWGGGRAIRFTRCLRSGRAVQDPGTAKGHDRDSL